MQQKAQKIVNHSAFQKVVSLFIIACSISLGLETLYQDNSFQEEKFAFKIVDGFFTFAFTTEIIIRMIAEGNLVRFWSVIRLEKINGKNKLKFNEHRFWNAFDTLIVILSIYSLSTHSLFVHPDLPIIARDLRILKVFRLFDLNDSIKVVEKRIIKIIPTVFTFLALLLILTYVYAIIGIYIFNYTNFAALGCGHADFSNILGAYITLFKVITLDSWWSDISTGIIECPGFNFARPWLVELYFITFIIMTVIISFNVFIAVLTNEVHQDGIDECNNQDLMKKMDELSTEINELKAIIKEGK